MTNKPQVDVQLGDTFIKNLKQLRKKYPHAPEDAQSLIKQLETGETPGDQIPGVGYTVYKARVSNTDTGHGKRGGYRIIYYVKTIDAVVLIAMYVKTAQVDISIAEIKQLIKIYHSRD
jgi:mRNA-degrading endonuclease RelE of RelBE toxin-antitoxin system